MIFERLLLCLFIWMPFLIGFALIAGPARWCLPADERLTFIQFIKIYPRYLLYIREFVFHLLFLPLSLFGMGFLVYGWGQIGIYFGGGIALAILNCTISLLELISSVSILNGYGGRFLRSQKFIRSPQVRKVALIRLSVSLLFIALLVLLARIIPKSVVP